MSHAYISVLVHIVFSTKNREALISEEMQAKLWPGISVASPVRTTLRLWQSEGCLIMCTRFSLYPLLFPLPKPFS